MNRLILTLLKNIGFPYACTSFAVGEAPKLPYLVFLIPRSDVTYADGTNFYTQILVSFELYTKRKDRSAERRVEQALEDALISYSKSEVFIPGEDMYEVIYEFEMEDENHEEKQS